MGRTKTHEEFCNEIFNKYGDEYTILEKYKGVHTHILVRHNTCGYEWKITPHGLLTNKNNFARCPQCNGGIRYSYKDIKEYIEKNSECLLITQEEEYIDTITPIILQCSCGNQFETTFINFKHENKRQCNQCGNQLRIEWKKYTYEEIKTYIESLNYVLLNEEYINSATPLLMKCNKGHIFEKIFNDLHQGSGCPECAILNNSGNNHWNWQGGITEISKHLRLLLINWKRDSMKQCNYKCIFTGKRFDDIHHLYSFNQIVKETFGILNLDIRNMVSDYSEEELHLIENTFIQIHNKYPLGVCLTKELHSLYHSIYGDINTPKQFEEFRNNYKNLVIM